MLKRLLQRLFGLGKVPRRQRAVLEREGIQILDEELSGWFITRRVNGPGKRYRHRREGFIGWLALTRTRLLLYSFRKRQINIALDDPRMTGLYVECPDAAHLIIAFESSEFRPDWSGWIEYRIRTTRASQFRRQLLAAGASPGPAPEPRP